MAIRGRSQPPKPHITPIRTLAANPALSLPWLPVCVTPIRAPRWVPSAFNAVAPVYLASTTASVPEQSWRGAVPIWLRRRPATALLVASTVRSFITSAAPASDKRAQNSMAVPYRLDLLQYQTLVGPISPLPSSGQAGGSGRGPLSMGVPYRVELTQYQAITGPVQLTGITAVQILWAPQLVTASRSQTGWGAAVSSGLTPPGPI